MPRPDNRISVGKTTLAILNGEMDLTEWTDEELERGQRRDRNGRWSGRKPKVVARELYDEFVQRKLTEASALLRESAYDAVEVLISIARDPNAENRDRLKAVDMILTRVMGKEPVKVELQVRQKWEDALDASVVTLAQMGEITDADWWERPEDDGEGMAPG